MLNPQRRNHEPGSSQATAYVESYGRTWASWDVERFIAPVAGAAGAWIGSRP